MVEDWRGLGQSLVIFAVVAFLYATFIMLRPVTLPAEGESTPARECGSPTFPHEFWAFLCRDHMQTLRNRAAIAAVSSVGLGVTGAALAWPKRPTTDGAAR